MGRAKQWGEGAACRHLGGELSWTSRCPSPFERGGSPYNGPLPGSGGRIRNIHLHLMIIIIIITWAEYFFCRLNSFIS